MAYEVVSSKKAFSGQILDVRQDVLTMPDGRMAEREIVERGEACAVLPVTADGEFVFVRQYRHSVGDYALEVPAGMLDSSDEEPEKCALRELEEETGLVSGRLSFMLKYYPTIGFCTEVLHIFLAEELSPGAQSLDDDEFLTVEKYSWEKAVEMIWNGTIIDSKTIIAVFAYKEFLKQR